MAGSKLVAKLMAVMSSNYANYKLTKEAIVFYSRILHDIPDDILEASALDICSKPGAFFPSAGDWRQNALDLKLAKSGVPMAIEAWEEAKHECGRCGEYWRYTEGKKYPEYSHPLIEETVKAIGYVNILESDNIEVLRAQFMKAYDAFKNRSQESQRMLPDVQAVANNYLTTGIRQLTEGMRK